MTIPHHNIHQQITANKILYDELDDKMSLIYEYGNRREQKGRNEGINEGMKEIIKSLLNSGETLPEISQKTGKTIQELKKILNK